MKKRLLYITALILIGITNSAFVYGQSGSTLDKLQGKTWRSQSRGGDPRDYKFTRSDKIYIIQNESWSRPFYLSDQIETKFDFNKVGKIENGKYIIVEGYDPDDKFFSVFVYEILKLDDTEFTIKLSNGSIAPHKALEVCTMKYVLNSVPTTSTPFNATKTAEFQAAYRFPINTTAIQDRLYTNVQLTQYTDVAAQKRGRFFRKFTPSGVTNRHIIVVSFGDTYDNRTDVLCLVDANGNILDKMEGRITVNGLTVKQYQMTSNGMTIYRVVPTSAASLPFNNITNFSGYITKTGFVVNGDSFSSVKTSGDVSKTGTVTESFLSNPTSNLWQYVVNGTTISYGE